MLAVEIAPPATADDLAEIKALFVEYARSLGFSLDYQGFDKELADFPGKYAAPEGALLLARANGATAGTVALRRLDDGICEMKRLYVRPDFRGQRSSDGRSIGLALIEGIVETARNRGYRRLRLDTIGATMQAAVKLYRTLGFVEIPPYFPSPIAGTVFMELVL
ncbi:MAG: GNAT family N-acetyltransferase [Alphaproteobacteria bacterium]|nr:GNAT family N-acetyltransferase [Alphaproteobacteria bacterium]